MELTRRSVVTTALTVPLLHTLGAPAAEGSARRRRIGYLPGWGYPTWSDEFDHEDRRGRPCIDPAKWNVKDRPSFGLLNDASVIATSQVTVTGQRRAKKRRARIRAEWMDRPIVTQGGPGGSNTERWHKTGYMDHRKPQGGVNYEQRFGVWEFRVKMPLAKDTSLGTLAAVWLRNSSVGEIDIVEGWGSGPAHTPANRYHPAGLKPHTGKTTLTAHGNTMGGGSKAAWTLSPAVYDTWQTYRFTWTPSLFELRVNGVVKVHERPGGQVGYLWTNPVFQRPWHLRVNLHVGASRDYWGLPDPGHREWTAGNQDFKIDYVRCYRY